MYEKGLKTRDFRCRADFGHRAIRPKNEKFAVNGTYLLEKMTEG